jgi:hypothetical protein
LNYTHGGRGARKPMETIVLTPIGYVQNARRALADDDWGEVVSCRRFCRGNR